MELNYHNIIKGLVLTTKSTDLYRKLGKYTFRVEKTANKLTIRKAVESLWDVKVDSVCVLATRGKTRRFAGKRFKTPDQKKAIITLKQGYKIELPGQMEAVQDASAGVGPTQTRGK